MLVDVDHTMKFMTEETFGPTLPIMKVADAEEAVRLANDSPYGLGASVFTRDTERGEQIARRLEAGAANVNDAMINYTVLELPMGGAKASGSARATARAGSASTAPSRRSSSRRGWRSSANRTCTRTRAAPRDCWPGVFKFLYGRGKRD